MSRATFVAGIGGGLIAAFLLAPATGTALGNLARVRGARAEAAAVVAAPVSTLPLVAPGLRTGGGDPARALAGRVRSLAAQGGVLVEQADAVAAQGGLVRLRVRLSGPDKAVVSLIDRIERGTPLMRMRSWTAAALRDGGLRIEGEVVGAWR